MHTSVMQRSRPRNGQPVSGMVEMTRRQAQTLADARARTLLGAPNRAEAFRRLAAGELEGTAAEAVFSGLRHLLQE